nr:hypothetical protein Q903MT_gene1363 [Picea sitchensis]
MLKVLPHPHASGEQFFQSFIIYVIMHFMMEREMCMHLFLPIGLRSVCRCFIYVAWV